MNLQTDELTLLNLCKRTAEDSEKEEKEFEQEEADFNTSNCLAKIRIKEQGGYKK